MIVAGWRRWLGFRLFTMERERDSRGRKREKIRERRFFFGYIF